MGSGKGSTQTSSVQIPASVLAQYNQVNQRANQVTNTPFQSYGGQFVAPVNAQEQTGIAATNQAAGSYQPYYNAATAATVAGGQAVDSTKLDSSAINQYMSPYLQDVAQSQEALNNQQFQQAQSGQLGTAITSGAFGGDRAGVAAANLQQQQSLANNSNIAGILNTGYNTALSTAQQQQGVGLAADQANRTALQQTGQSLAGLGTASQTAGLTGAAAQTSAGQLQQQTQQAQDTALYNQFLQQQSLPYQQLQLAANVAEGTGSLSGSTTTSNSTQNGIFSDKRLKEDTRKVGETYDGQPIYTFKYKGHPETHMGLMAQDVEMRDADAVGLASGYKTVDYRKATDKAAKRGHFAAGGAPNDWQSILGQYQQMYGGLLSAQGGTNGGTLVPQSTSQPHELKTAQLPAVQQANPLKDAASLASDVDSIGKVGDKLGAWNYGDSGDKSDDAPDTKSMNATQEDDIFGLKRGGRTGLAIGGDASDPANPYGAQGLNIPDDQQKYSLDPAKAPGSQGGQGLLGTIKDVAGIAKTIASFASGGSVDGDKISAIHKAILLALNPMAQHATGQADPDAPDAQSGPDDTSDDTPDAANDDAPYAPASQQPIAVNGRGLGIQMDTPDSTPRSGHLDPQVVSFLKGKGLSDGQALGIAAGIYAESGNNPNADNPSSHALGLGQWLGSRKKGLVGQFGDSPSKSDQLSYLMQELNGGDRGGSAVLGASDPSDVLNAYVKRFMRPHAGAETTGDINRGLGALRQGFADGGVPDDFLPDASDYLADQGGVSNVDLPPSRDAGPDTVAPVVDKPKALAIAAMPDKSQGLATPPDNEADLDVTSQRRPDDLLPTDFSKPVKGSEPPRDTGGDDTHGSFFHNLKHGSADAIIPILTGLGAFGTANTNNPLTALATGLGAGAGEYQKMREFELEPQQLGINRMTATAGVMNQQNQMANNARQIAMGMYKYLPTNPSTPWLNTRTGQYETNEQHQSTIDGMVSQIYSRKIPGMPDMSLPATGTPPAAGAEGNAGAALDAPDAGDVPAPKPVNTAPAATTAPSAPNAITTPTLRPALPRGASSGVRAVNGEYNGQSVLNAIPPVDDSNVPAQNRISTLQGNYERLRAAGQTDAADAIQQQIQAINSGHQIVLDNNGQQYQGYAQHQQAVQAAQQTYDQKVKQRTSDVGTAQQVVGQEYQPIHQLLTGMAHNLKDNNLNRGSPELANLIGQLRSIPGLGHIGDAFAQYEGATDINQKSAALLAMKQAGSLSGAPAAALTEALETVPDATRDPAAKYKIITQALGNLEQSKDYSNDLIKNQNKVVDTAAFSNDWHNEPRHSATAYELRARKGTPYFAGMTPEQMQQAPTPGHAPDPSQWDFNHAFTPPGQNQVMYWNPITKKAYRNPQTPPSWYKGGQ